MTGPAKPEQLGTQLARLHLHNIEKVYAGDESCSFVGATRKNPPPIRQFGFHITTYSGYMPLINEWSENWVVIIFDFFSNFTLTRDYFSQSN
uniref:Protein-ribulosamine 3-kinase n=1 Tax=Ascaris lumbricoides TaxID=6252 RepID=A0A0M3HL04_ASCLU